MDYQSEIISLFGTASVSISDLLEVLNEAPEDTLEDLFSEPEDILSWVDELLSDINDVLEVMGVYE